MIIPKSIKVGPYNYAIEFKTPILSDNNERLSGQCRHTELRILIDPDAAPAYQFETFVHEAMHAIDHVAHADIDEDAVSRISTVLAAFLLDNGYVLVPSL